MTIVKITCKYCGEINIVNETVVGEHSFKEKGELEFLSEKIEFLERDEQNCWNCGKSLFYDENPAFRFGNGSVNDQSEFNDK